MIDRGRHLYSANAGSSPARTSVGSLPYFYRRHCTRVVSRTCASFTSMVSSSSAGTKNDGMRAGDRYHICIASFVRSGHYKKVIRQGHKKIIREGHNEVLCKGMLLKRTGFTIRQYVAREAYIVFVYDRLVE